MSGSLHYFSRFLPSPEHGGGSRRLLQVIELAGNLGLNVVSSAPAAVQMEADRQCREAMRSGVDPRTESLGMWSEERRTAVSRLRAIAAGWTRDLPANMAAALVDDPVYFEPLVDALDDRGIPWMAVCHNLESLAPSQAAPGRALDLLQQETSLLKRARQVATISREETWLLSNLGIPCLRLPYFPAEPIRLRLESVRLRRQTSGKEGILMIGTARNPGTRSGMESAASFWQAHGLHQTAGHLLLAGHDSNRHFRPGQFGPGVEVVGPLDDESHDRLLARVQACLCYQESGAGALTRITEMLLAGVPVLANSHAARSQHGAPGLVEFTSLGELGRALGRLEVGPPAFPPPAAPDPEAMTTLLRGLAGG